MTNYFVDEDWEITLPDGVVGKAKDSHAWDEKEWGVPDKSSLAVFADHRMEKAGPNSKLRDLKAFYCPRGVQTLPNGEVICEYDPESHGNGYAARLIGEYEVSPPSHRKKGELRVGASKKIRNWTLTRATKSKLLLDSPAWSDSMIVYSDGNIAFDRPEHIAQWLRDAAKTAMGLGQARRKHKARRLY